MYAHFYQLSESPFNLTPDPKFHYVNESTREALASILHGIKSRKGFVTLIAEAGTGKTTLLRRIVEEIEGETQVVFVFNPGVSFDELLEFICSELGLDTRGCKRLHLLDRLNTHLLAQLTAGRNVVVMIDEAQTLEDSVLEELRLLSNLETSKEKILQIVLSGQPELEEKLRRPSLRQLRQRIGVRATLKPVRLAEMQPYVETRLRGAGAVHNDLFTAAALKKVWQASQGIPRVINVICDNAMMIAFAEGQRRITPKTLREAMRDLGTDLVLGDYAGARPWWRSSRAAAYALAAALVLAVSVPLAGLVLRSLERPPSAYTVAAAAPASQPANPETASDVAPSLARDSAADLVARPSDRAGDDGAIAAPRLDDIADMESRAALESDVSQRPLVRDSIRRAEILARSTAARLYDVDRGSAGAGRKDLAEAALDEVARDRGLTELALRQYQESDTASVDAPVADANPGAQRDAATDEPAASVGRAENAAVGVAVAAPPALPEQNVVAATVVGETPPSLPVPSIAPAQPAEPVEAAPPVAAVAPTATATAPPPAASPPPEPKAAPLKVAPAANPAAAASTAASRPREPKAAPQKVAPAAKRAATAPPATVLAPATPTSAPPLGRSVRVRNGDTVWDIAIRQYGEAGVTVVKRILAFNGHIRDPLKLEVGSTVFLPYNRPDQMISRDASGYRILLASSPLHAEILAVANWARSLSKDLQVALGANQEEQQHEVYVIGLTSEALAVNLAMKLLERVATSNGTQRTAMR